MYFGQALAGRCIGLDPLDDGTYLVYCYRQPIGILDTNSVCSRPNNFKQTWKLFSMLPV